MIWNIWPRFEGIFIKRKENSSKCSFVFAAFMFVTFSTGPIDSKGVTVSFPIICISSRACENVNREMFKALHVKSPSPQTSLYPFSYIHLQEQTAITSVHCRFILCKIGFMWQLCWDNTGSSIVWKQLLHRFSFYFTHCHK